MKFQSRASNPTPPGEYIGELVSQSKANQREIEMYKDSSALIDGFVDANWHHYCKFTLRVVRATVLLSAVFVALIPITSDLAQASVSAGKAFAQANCSHCHSIDKFTPSTLAIAPPFRTLHERYPVESLAEALGEGIVTGHPSMPEFRLDPGQVRDFISFLKSLEQ